VNGPAPKVLIVDDQPANVHILAEALGTKYELLVATDARRALELAPSVDLILLDVVMPELDGLEVCRRLRADPATARIPVIFVTSREQTEDEMEGFGAGAVDYIVKPIRPAVVRARVRTHLELKNARDALEQLAIADALTGIANRRRFDETLTEEWRRAVRTGRSLTLALADIDHFKAFNDTHGHAGGDACLVEVARSLDALCRRPGELAARYGGEEFGLILPEVGGAEAVSFVRRALEAVTALKIEGLSTPVSVSIGAVTVLPTPDLDALAALKLADDSLYRAKRNGRGRGVLRSMDSDSVSEIVPEPVR